MHISLPRTPVIYNNNVYLTAPSIPLRPPLRRQSTCPYRRSTRSDGRRGSKNGRHGRKDRHANRTPRDGSPNIHHLRPTIRRHRTKRRGAIYDTRRPTGRNHRRMTTRPRRPAQHPRLSMRPTSCRLRAAAGVINGAPTTRKRQENPTGRNHRRHNTPAAACPTPATVQAADILPPAGGNGRHKWRPYDTQMPR